ncbi:MAG: hypothetical protein V3U35_01820 [Candidatus Neomarinimicrobiota bacterium]
MIHSKLARYLLMGMTILWVGSCYKAPPPAPVTEADPPLTMPVALANIDKGMKMMGDMQMMMEMVMKKQQESMGYGKELFNDATLAGATRGMSCNGCHPDGATTGGEAEIPPMLGYPGWKMPIPNLHGAAATFPKFKVPNAEVISLAQMNNNCLSMFVGGKHRLPLNGAESHALALYVTSLSQGVAVEPGKMQMMDME